MHQENLESLAGAVARSGRLVVLTGAGMGLASGIPTFRGSDPDAVWAKDVTELGTNAYFRRSPGGSWRWYRSRFSRLAGALPNAGHHALVAIERWQLARSREFLLVTQNIDTLHGQAGSDQLVEVHGRADRVRCSRHGCRYAAPRGWLPTADFDWAGFDAVAADPAKANAAVPRCPACSAPIRAHVLWFDEYYTEHVDYQFERAIRAFSMADVILCVGTSFSVGITAAALQVPGETWNVDPSEAAQPAGVRWLKAEQEVALPALARALGA